MNMFEDNLYMPKYIKIQNYILMKIDCDEFKIGEKIPSECELAKKFDVSRVTANVAIKELATRGIVERIRGKGTFVVLNKANSDQDDLPMVFSNGIKLNPINNKEYKKHILISHEIVEADMWLSEKLRIGFGEKVYKIVRKVNSSSRAEELDYSFIPLSVLGSHTIQINNIASGCLHDYIKDNLTRKPRYVKIFINSQPQKQMDFSIMENNSYNQLFIWDTYVYDDEGVIALTVTASLPRQNKPFILMEI